jgi:Cys-tRNA(Pro)/Cys-tRNA(Cys) deacylase
MAGEKTNVMRILDQKKTPYVPHSYPYAGGPVDGVTVAETLGVDPEMAFKTLVTRGAGGQYYVFVVPVLLELDLKAAAKAAGEKSIEMIRQAELLPLTGYIHGGCSPVGMKKTFPTFIDERAQDLETMMVSAGKPGFQVELAPAALANLVRARFSPITK